MADCCNSFGGTIYIEADGERLTPGEGNITLMPTRFETEEMTNQDGSTSYKVTPRSPRAELTFRNGCGFSWAGWMGRCALNVTIVEETNGRQHLFTATRFVGRPSLDLSSGEVSGVSIAGGTYRFVEG